MICGGCGRANREGRHFCGGCGASLEHACPSCAFVNTGDDRFCGGCGDTLSQAAVVAAPGGVAMLAPDAVRALLAELAPVIRPAALPDGVITQDDLDRFFTGGAA
ncbi:MAG: zinc ribbon domain-containing protein [Deltaproteobacteria bacterium]|nr:zinc ribbon domain-containing protein [Deltaproteobacteria bacterium]